MVICFCAVYKSKVFSLWSIKTVTRFTGILEGTSPSPHHMPFGSLETRICSCFQQTHVYLCKWYHFPRILPPSGWVINKHQNRHLGKGSMQQEGKKSKEGRGVQCQRPRRRHCACRARALVSPLCDGSWQVCRQVTNSSWGPCSDAALYVFRCRRKPVSK